MYVRHKKLGFLRSRCALCISYVREICQSQDFSIGSHAIGFYIRYAAP